MNFIIVFLLGAGFGFSLCGAEKQYLCGAHDIRNQSSQICHLVSEAHYKDLVDDFLVGARDQFLDFDCGHRLCKACTIGNILRFDNESCFVCKKPLSFANVRELGLYRRCFKVNGFWQMISFRSYPDFECQSLADLKDTSCGPINLDCGHSVCRGCLFASIIELESPLVCFVCSRKLSLSDKSCLKQDPLFVRVACLRQGCSPLRLSGEWQDPQIYNVFG